MEIEIKMETEVEVVLEKLMKAEGNAVKMTNGRKGALGLEDPLRYGKKHGKTK